MMTTSSTGGGGLLFQSSLLQQAEAKVEASVPASQKANYLKIVVAGMKLALNKGPNGLVGALKNSKDPMGDIVNGAIGIVGILRRESKNTMPLPVMVPAIMTLVLHGLDIAQKFGLLQIGPAELGQATQQAMETIMQKVGLTPQKVQQLAAQSHGVMQDPQAMNKLSAGMQPAQIQQPQGMPQ